jgi:HEAT repeat protein
MNPLKVRRSEPFKWWQSAAVSVGVLVCLVLLVYGSFVLLRLEYIEWQIDKLKDPNETVRAQAAEKLRKIGTPAVEPLIRALSYGDPTVRAPAAAVLGEIKDPRVVDPLIAALKDNNRYVRQSAAWALGDVKDPRAVDSLIAALKDTNDEDVLCKALGKIGTPAVEPLIAALKDSDRSVRHAAAESLGEINDPRAVEPLIAALKDTDASVRMSAAYALDNIKDPRAVEPLIAALQEDPASDVRDIAAKALIASAKPGSEDALIEALYKSHNASFAEDLLNCGNTKLEDAARKWAVRYGFQITPDFWGDSVTIRRSPSAP